MKNFFIQLSIIILVIVSYSFSKETININIGVQITVDGKISLGEWDEAGSIEIVSKDSKLVKVLFKHDGNNLLFAFLDNLGSAKFRFPEIFLDINNDQSQSWMNDDWWFHVSNTNCFNKGMHSVYNATTCKTKQPDWEANNFNISLPDTVEIKIPFSLIGLDTTKTKLSISFDVTDTFSAWEFFPDDADINSPDTWAKANIVYNATVVENENNKIDAIKCYPNPFSESTSIKYILGYPEYVNIDIYNSLGNKIANILNEFQDAGEHKVVFDGSNYPSGVYYVIMSYGHKFYSKKTILIK